ncbi:MAG TPA: 50S ribosomal protein L9 [Myxococcales bacterium]|nr:50S ribosomal protein L9 [Deltaproteobacteria bacterium]HAA56327.1 50S ribosomal protein L9 [Myxococcales bacterium]|tara:strand:+ start:1255 stop:1698 length:444 start_codon:yes stop_codon:yes gene_type:complete
MKVILKEEIKGFGKPGEIVKVADGYARNFLLPRDLAAVATEKNVRRLEHEKRQIFLRQEKAKREALKLAEELKATSVTITRQVGEEDRIFGSVTTRDIGEALREENFKIHRRQITMDDSVKKLGVYECQIKLHPEVTVPVKVWVVAQ